MQDERDKEIRRLRKLVSDRTKALKELTGSVEGTIALLDRECQSMPGEQGSRIAKIINALQYTNDSVRHFDLGEKFPLKRPNLKRLDELMANVEEHHQTIGKYR